MELLTAPNEAILADLAKVYVACPGTPLYHAPCIMCGTPLRSETAVVYALVILDPCPEYPAHLLAGAAARHASCEPADAGGLYEAVIAAVVHDRAG